MLRKELAKSCPNWAFNSSFVTFGREFQVEFLQPFSQSFIETLCVFFLFKGADEIVRVPDETGFPATVWDHHFVKPQIEHEVQVDVGKDR